MIARAVLRVLEERFEHYPAVVLVGPRQSGKTTLARSLGGAYFDLESEADRTRLDVEWERQVGVAARDGAGPLVLDEAQSWPELFPRLRGAIDADRGRNGRFLLLGSIAPSRMQNVAESLAGRLAIVV